MAAIVTSFSVYKRGKELEDDPEFQRRVAAGEYEFMHTEQKKEYVATGCKKRGCYFAIGVVLVLILGSLLSFFRRGMEKIINPNGHPDDYVDCSFIDHDCGESSSNKFNSGSVFRAGLMGLWQYFGVSWMTATFLMLIRQS